MTQRRDSEPEGGSSVGKGFLELRLQKQAGRGQANHSWGREDCQGEEAACTKAWRCEMTLPVWGTLSRWGYLKGETVKPRSRGGWEGQAPQVAWRRASDAKLWHLGYLWR